MIPESVRAWVEEVRALCQPDAVYWCDGSEEERQRLTAEMVRGMKPGAVIVDLAAETGGNCELTKAGETVVSNGVAVIGPVNLASMGAIHSSEMYSRNLFNFLSLMLKDGALNLDWSDELIEKTCLTHDGVIKHEASRVAVEGAAPEKQS